MHVSRTNGMVDFILECLKKRNVRRLNFWLKVFIKCIVKSQTKVLLHKPSALNKLRADSTVVIVCCDPPHHAFQS